MDRRAASEGPLAPGRGAAGRGRDGGGQAGGRGPEWRRLKGAVPAAAEWPLLTPRPRRVPVPGHSRANAALPSPRVRLAAAAPGCPLRSTEGPGEEPYARRITQAEQRRKDSEESLCGWGGKKCYSVGAEARLR